ncbi:hypothetical protein [Roseomonas sp. WA12]
MAMRWDDRLEEAARTRGTVTILCREGEKAEIAAAAEAVGFRHRLRPQIDRAPADGIRVGYRDEHATEDSPIV